MCCFRGLIKITSKSSPPPPENNVVILDVITLCNHLIMKTTLAREGRETKRMQKEYKIQKMYQEFCPRLY